MISSYSLISAVLVFNIALILVYTLRRRSNFLINCGTGTLGFLVLLGFVRLFSPLDFSFARVIHSYIIVPAVRDFLIGPIGGTWFSPGRILLLLWALGALVFAVRDLACILRDKRLRGQYVPARCENAEAAAASLGLKDSIMLSQSVSTPHVAGFFRPMIYLPPLELSVEQWQYVLRHEKQHVAARDTLIKLFYSLVRAIFWWNPISHLFMRELDAILELRCDASLARQFSEEEKLDYFSATLSVLKQLTPGASPAGGLKPGLVKSEGDLHQRFEVLLRYDPRKSRAMRNAVYTLILALFIGSYCVIIQPCYTPPEEELVGAYTIPGDTTADSFIVYENGEYVFYLNGYAKDTLTEDQLGQAPYNSLKFFRPMG